MKPNKPPHRQRRRSAITTRVANARDTIPREPAEGIQAASSETLYGLNPVLEALRAGRRQIEQITVAEGARPERLREILELARQAHVPVQRVPRIQLDRAGGDPSHQGVMARLAAARYHDADDLLDSFSSVAESPLALGLDGIEDPRNLGAILRTAECAGVHGVFIPERRAVGLNETVAKTAAGALEYVPVARVTNLVRLIGQLKERNIWVIGADAAASSLYTEWDWTLPTALFLGSEGSGLHRLVRESCDALLRIPVAGKLESLNVSVAAGVMLYEARRQRMTQATALVKSEAE
jgi:23S rRNA (guanosine2251-2'-O)-methyltransferase